MKFSVTNLGRIAEASIEVKPLTVFVGKTNTNKTWTAYALYGALRSLTYIMRHGFVVDKKEVPACEALDNAIAVVAKRTAQILEEQASLFAQTDEGQSFTFEVSRDDILQEANKPASVDLCLRYDNIAALLASESTPLSGAEATLSMDYAFFTANGKVKSLRFVVDKQYVKVSATLKAGGVVQVNTLSTFSKELPTNYLYDEIFPFIKWMCFAIFNDALGFPAERKAVAALSALIESFPRNFLKLGGSNPLTVPCADFLRFLSTSRFGQLNRVGPLSNFATILERSILNGRAEFYGPPESRAFGYRGDNGPLVQMHASASLVRSLAGLDVYLRQTQMYDVIMIDEPEMNAHPKAQLKLVELFAMLANKNLYVIITTHSPYFLEHLNNLLEAAKVPAVSRSSLAEKTKLKSADSFISVDKVAAYLFREDGDVSSLIRDGIIDTDTFSDETNYLNDFASSVCNLQNSGHKHVPASP